MSPRRLGARLLAWGGGGWGIAQLAAIVIVAALAGHAALAYSNANDGWQDAVRMEVAHMSALQEDARTVYGDEAPATFRLVLEEQTAAELGKIGRDNRLAVTQRAASADAARNLRTAYRKYLPNSLASDPQYRTSSGGVDVIARLRVLADAEIAERKAHQLPVPDPAAAQRTGDASAVRGLLLSLAAALVSLVVAAHAFMYHRPRHRRGEHEAVNLVETPRLSRPGSPRWTATVILAFWAVGAVLPLSQLITGAEEQRSLAASARLATTLMTDIAVSNARAAFMTQSRQTASELGVRAAARYDAAAHASRPDAADQRAVALAETRAATTVERIAIAMSRTPVADDRLEPAMLRALSSTTDDWPAQVPAQNAQTTRANRWGGWSNNATLVIILITGGGALAAVHHKYTEVQQDKAEEKHRAATGTA